MKLLCLECESPAQKHTCEMLDVLPKEMGNWKQNGKQKSYPLNHITI